VESIKETRHLLKIAEEVTNVYSWVATARIVIGQLQHRRKNRPQHPDIVYREAILDLALTVLETEERLEAIRSSDWLP
jgi:hypothetical protein